MSWSIKLTGLKAAVCKEVVECQQMPPLLKKTVLEVASLSELNGLSVDSSGHMGPGPCVYRFEVMPVHLVMDSPPKPEPAPAPVPAAQPAPVAPPPAPVADVTPDAPAPAAAVDAAI